MWESFVELLRLTIFCVAHWFGGSLGAAVVLVSAGVRLILLPWTIRIARQARAQQALILRLAPQMERMKQQYSKDPAELLSHTRALYAANGVKFMTPSGIVNMLVQLPLLSGLFAAVRSGLGARVRFLWIADLARPDMLLLSAVTALSALAFVTIPVVPGQPRPPSAVWFVSIIMSMAFLWSASSAIALSMGAGSLVSVLQNWLVAKDAKRNR